MTILSRFNMLDIVPSVSIVIIILLSLYAYSANITYYGIIIGLILDIAFGEVIGVRALAYYLIAYYTFKHRKLDKGIFSYGILAVIVSSLFYDIYIYLVRAITTGVLQGQHLLYYVTGYLISDLIINLILYLILFQLFKLVLRKKNVF